MTGLGERSLRRVSTAVKRAEDTPRFAPPATPPRNRTQVLVQLVSPTEQADDETGLYPAVWHSYDRQAGGFLDQSACWLTDANNAELTPGHIYLARAVSTHPTDGKPIYATEVGAVQVGSGSGAGSGVFPDGPLVIDCVEPIFTELVIGESDTIGVTQQSGSGSNYSFQIQPSSIMSSHLQDQTILREDIKDGEVFKPGDSLDFGELS